MRALPRPTRALVLFVAFSVVMGACSASVPDAGSNPPSGGSAGAKSLTLPLPPFDAAAFGAAEAALRKDGRDKAGVSKLGPGAVEFTGYMDRTASFLLSQAPAKLKTASAQSGGRLAAPSRDIGLPGAPVLGTYLMTTQLFTDLIGTRSYDATHVTSDTPEKCPCTKEATLDPTKDEVSIEGNKGTITTTMTVKATVGGSKISVDIKLKVEGEVRDAKTGALLYKISSEATGHAEGDSCPDASGVAHATMSFGGNEDYFDSSGAKTGNRVFESFGGQVSVRADDNAKLAAVEVTPSGQGGQLMVEMAMRGAAPAFEKAWRSGMCIQVVVSPNSDDVDPESATTITVKVKHKIEGNELDKPVEAKLTSGVKSIEPSGQKQKAPATFTYTAGPESGDRGDVSFESVSNRGIGHDFGSYTVAGGWTISGSGASNEDFQGGFVANTLRISISDLKVKAAKGGGLSGAGTMTLSGEVTTGAGLCRGNTDQTLPITVTGTLVGTGADAVLRLTISSPATPGVMVMVLCRGPFGGQISQSVPAEGHSDRYGEALGAFDLPAAGGTKTVSRTTAIGGVMNVAASGTFTVTKTKK